MTISTTGKTVKIVIIRVKFRRCAGDPEKLRFQIHSKTIKLWDLFISFFFLINGKIFKIGPQKINYDFFKRPHKSLCKILASMLLVEGVFLKIKYNLIRSSDQYPCLVLGLVYRKLYSSSRLEVQEFYQHAQCVTQFCTNYCS